MSMSIKNKLQYLDKHFKYWTINPWNRSESFAFNIKVYNIIPKDLQNKAYDLLSVDDPAFWEYVKTEIDGILKEFCGEDYTSFINGRSGGYLILDKEGDSSYFSNRINDFSDILGLYELGHISEYQRAIEDYRYSINKTYQVVKNFDTACGYIKRFFINLVKNAQIEDVEVVSTQKIITY